MKDAEQEVAQEVAEDLAEDVSGAAEDGSSKVFVLKPRRCGGWVREGVLRGTRHFQAAEPKRQKRYAAARGDPDASPTPGKALGPEGQGPYWGSRLPSSW